MSLPTDLEKTGQRTRAADWFAALRDRITAAFEAVEDAVHNPCCDRPAGRFVHTPWTRPAEDGIADGGGGTMAVMRGRVFEKVGVNISTVMGRFSPEFRATIPGAAESDGLFWASGISLVCHPCSPLVPAVHMNTRHLITSKAWFGGGADLTPVEPDARDTADFHAALKRACDGYESDAYARYKDWCDRYFFLPHRNETRGVGGIFFDGVDSGDWARDFAFVQAVGEAFLAIYPELVRRHMNTPWTPEQRRRQLIKRGRYVEFNLLYDRGTTFGLKTGGNPEAILMSMPPEVAWP